MARAVARVLDMWAGICCCHPPVPCVGMAGIIITSSATVFAEGKPTARLGDVVIGFCGHPGVIASSSSTVLDEGPPAARIGDLVVGCTIGTIITAAASVSAE